MQLPEKREKASSSMKRVTVSQSVYLIHFSSPHFSTALAGASCTAASQVAFHMSNFCV